MRSGLNISRGTKKFLARFFTPGTDHNTPLPIDKNLLVSNKGFTLAEVLVSLTLLAVGVIAVVSMFTVSMHANLKATQMSAANYIGQEALEDILAKDITDPVFAVTTTTPATYYFDNDSTASPSLNTTTVTNIGTYSATYSITLNTSATTGYVEYAQVDVRVTGTGILPVTFTGFKRLV